MWEVLKWVGWSVALVFATLFIVLLAHAGADAEARSERGLLAKLINLAWFPLLMLLMVVWVTGEYRRVYYPPNTPQWITLFPAFQITAVVSVTEYIGPALLYLLSVCMLLWKTHKLRAQRFTDSDNKTAC